MPALRICQILVLPSEMMLPFRYLNMIGKEIMFSYLRGSKMTAHLKIVKSGAPPNFAKSGSRFCELTKSGRLSAPKNHAPPSK